MEMLLREIPMIAEISRPVAAPRRTGDPARPATPEPSCAARIIYVFRPLQEPVMEAERINAVANRIADLSGRGEQLRRYL